MRRAGEASATRRRTTATQLALAARGSTRSAMEEPTQEPAEKRQRTEEGAEPETGGAPIIVTGYVDLEDLDPDDFGGYEM